MQIDFPDLRGNWLVNFNRRETSLVLRSSCLRGKGDIVAGEQKIAEMVRQLNRLEARIKRELSHVRMLRGVRANIEARTLVEASNDLGRAAVELEDYLLQLIGEA